jgi:hypothetical protein
VKNLTLTIGKGTQQHKVIKSIHISDQIPQDASEIIGDIDVKTGHLYTYSVNNQDNILFDWRCPTEWIGSSTTNKITVEFVGNSGASYVTVTPRNGCGSGASSTLELTVDIKQRAQKEDRFTIYPNPAKEYITLSGNNILDSYMYNNMGVLVKTINEYSANSQIFIGDLQAGIYYISVNIDNVIYTKSFSIVK